MIDYSPNTSPTPYRSNLLFIYFAWKALQFQIILYGRPFHAN